MDAVTLVAAALTAGATAGLTDTTAEVRDAHAALLKLVIRRLIDNPKALEVLVGHAAEPDSYYRPLIKQLEAAHIDGAQDADLLEAAQQLLSQVDPAGVSSGSNTIHISGSGRAGAIGDHGTVYMETDAVQGPPGIDSDGSQEPSRGGNY